MQSSAGVAGRALIMLACVIGIPLLAMSGTSWSEILSRLQDLHFPTILDPASASTSTPTDDAHRVAPSGPSPATTASRGSPGFLQSTSALELAQTSSAPAWGQALTPAKTGVIPAGYQSLADAGASGLPLSATGETTVGGASFAAEPFRSIQDRLRELGATYYLLESWGNRQQMFRFYCKMAVGGNPNYTHYFEAMESDPLQAMRQVLAQVETWREGGTLARQQ